MSATPILPKAPTPREQRGLELFKHGVFERHSENVWLVYNPERRTEHVVDLETGKCSCKDFVIHGHLEGFKCKHLIATRLYSEWIAKIAKRVAPAFDEEIETHYSSLERLD
jgi:predicted nucleic acid-binding Zn finger protein